MHCHRHLVAFIDENNHVKGHKIFHHRLVIDFQYQSINWHRLLSIDIDYHRVHQLVTHEIHPEMDLDDMDV